MNNEDWQEARMLGFRDAPSKMTPACLGYMARIIELREFTSVVFTLMKNAQDLPAVAPKAATEIKKVAEEKRLTLVSYDYKTHRQFVNEIMLTRAIESFDLYVLTVLRHLFEKQPNILKSEAPIDAATALELGSFEEIVRHLAERKLHDLAYKPLSDLAQFVQSRTGIELFASKPIYEMVLLASEVRNLIAHNDCKVSPQFKSRTRGIENPLQIAEHGKVLVDDNWLRRVSYTLDGVVFDFDEAAVQKFDLKTAGEAGFVLQR